MNPLYKYFFKTYNNNDQVLPGFKYTCKIKCQIIMKHLLLEQIMPLKVVIELLSRILAHPIII